MLLFKVIVVPLTVLLSLTQALSHQTPSYTIDQAALRKSILYHKDDSRPWPDILNSHHHKIAWNSASTPEDMLKATRDLARFYQHTSRLIQYAEACRDWNLLPVDRGMGRGTPAERLRSILIAKYPSVMQAEYSTKAEADQILMLLVPAMLEMIEAKARNEREAVEVTVRMRPWSDYYFRRGEIKLTPVVIESEQEEEQLDPTPAALSCEEHTLVVTAIMKVAKFGERVMNTLRLA